MNIKQWMVLVTALAAGLTASHLPAQESATKSPPSPLPVGVIKGDNVNVRGKPTLGAEVVAQLKNGDRVKILEEITLKDPPPNEPNQWLRISLPETVHVWVHSSYIDSATKTVTANQLNLRSGPGQNYSVLGRVPKGTVVKEMETQGEWLKIAPPTGTFAFVAAFLVSVEPPSATPPPPVAKVTEPAVAPPPIEEVALQPPVSQPAVTEPIVTEPAATEPPLVTPPGTEDMLAAETPETTLPELPAPAEAQTPESPPKRIVRREGIVRRSVSIQAPTYFSLENIENKRTINYLHSPASNNIVLKDYFGARVVVTGEELLDERWPKIPVISVEAVETIP